jgi:hypothetical protein
VVATHLVAARCAARYDGADASGEFDPMKLLSRRGVVAGLPLLAAPGFGWATPASSIPVAALIQPQELVAVLRASPPPLVLHVGFRVLYDRAHIEGSAYTGPARDPEGLKLLSAKVAGLPRDTAIVIYCGCCPWSHCPNIAAAHEALTGEGFTRVRVLYIAENFGTDWIDKGYPAKQAP